MRLAYRDHAGTASTRTVDPLGLVDKDGVWYLLARSGTGRRTFRVDRVDRVDRVAAAEEPGEAAERGGPAAGSDVAAAWAEVEAEVERARSRSAATLTLPDAQLAPFTATLGARYVEVLGSAQGRTRLTVRADTPTMIARQLTGWADVVEVEGPAVVRAELVRLGRLLTSANGG